VAAVSVISFLKLAPTAGAELAGRQHALTETEQRVGR
jgi:hypothetical protein